MYAPAWLRRPSPSCLSHEHLTPPCEDSHVHKVGVAALLNLTIDVIMPVPLAVLVLVLVLVHEP